MEVAVSSNNNYDEIEKLIESRVKEVRIILKEKHNFSVPEECDEFLKRCLRVKDGNLEKAVQLVLAFHSSISTLLGWDIKLRPSLFTEQCRSDGIVTPLKNRDASGRRIFIMRICGWDPKNVTFEQAAVGAWMLGQYVNAELIDVQREGVISIFDFNNLTLQQAWAVNQWRLLVLVRMIQGVGGRVKAIHIINHPRIANVIYAGIKPFLSEKLTQRIHFHSDQQSLLNRVGAGRLPDFLGGTIPFETCIDRECIEDFLKYDHFFEEMEKYKLPIK